MDLLFLYILAFTMKANTDVELGSVSKNNSLDDSKMQPNVYTNPLTGVAGTYCPPSCAEKLSQLLCVCVYVCVCVLACV